MARELNPEPNYAPIDSEALAVYTMEPVAECPATSMKVSGVLTGSPYEEAEGSREYEVEVEFRAHGRGLDDESFEEYLRSFEDAKISQEAMTALIEKDLRTCLGTDEVFVMVRRTAPADKRTRIGAIRT